MARAFNAFTSKLRRWLGDNTSKRAHRKEKHKPASRRLAIEHLEDRVVPAPLNYGQIASKLGSQVRSLATDNSLINAISQSTGDLPILGKSFQSQLQNAQTAVNSASTAISNSLTSLASGSSATAIRNALLNAKVVGDTDGNGRIDGSDVQIANNFSAANGNLEITMALGYAYPLGSNTSFAFNLGLPGLPFGLAATSRLSLDVNVGFNQLTFGMTNGTPFARTAANLTNTFTIGLEAKAIGTSVQGTMGFFSITGREMKFPNGQSRGLPTIQLNAGLQMNANSFSLSVPTLTGNAQLNLALDARFDPSLNSGNVSPVSTFPHLVTDFQVNWPLTGSSTGPTNQLGSAPTVQFNNIQFGVGTYLGSMVAPIADIVQQITAPLEPVFELLAARLPGLSDLSEPLGLGPITLEKLSSVAIAAGVLPPDYQFMAELGYNLHMLVKTLRSANLTAGDVLIPMGSFDLSDSRNGDLRTVGLTNGASSLDDWATKLKNFDPTRLENFADLTKLVPHVTDAVTSIESRIHTLNFGPAQRAVDAAFTQIKTQLSKLENGIGLSFPLIEDPASVYKLFLGQDVHFVKLEAKFKDTASKSGSLKVWGPIDASFQGDITYNLQLEAGVDTFGLRAFFVDLIKSNARKADLGLLDDGLYVNSSRELARINGRIKANAGISQSFGAGLQLFAYAGLEGEIETPRDFVLKFVDPNQRGDHKLRLLKSGEVGPNLFVVDASLTARFKFVVEAGVRVNLVFTDVEKKFTVFSYDLAKKDLFDTSKIDTRNPFLNLVPNDEPIDVIYDANFQDGANDGEDDTIRVRATTNWLYVYHNGVSTRYRLRNVNSLRIVGSDDNEDIIIEGSVRNFGVFVDGGLGRDSLTFDDSALNSGNAPRYFISDGRLTRTGTTAASAPMSTSISYANIDGRIDVWGSDFKKNSFYITPTALPTFVNGGDNDDKFYIGSTSHTLDGALHNVEINGRGGFNSLYLDDSGDAQRATYSLGREDERSVRRLERRNFNSFYSERQNTTFTQFLSDEVMAFYAIDYVNLKGTNNGNDFAVDDLIDPDAPSTMEIDLNTGRGDDFVALVRTTDATNVFGQAGSDVVHVGTSFAGTRNIYGDVGVDNTGGFTTLNVNDSGATVDRTVLLDATSSGDRGFIYGLTRTPVGGFGQSRISYKAADMAAVNVLGGGGVNTFSVGNTARRGGANDLRTTITTGSGSSAVYVGGTSGALTIDARGSYTGLNVGSLPNQDGRLSRIRGPVTLRGKADVVTIEDSGSTGNTSTINTMDASHYTRNNLVTGAEPADIDYGQLHISSFSVALGNANDTLIVNGTPALSGGLYSGVVNLLTGKGNDTAYVLGTDGPISLDLEAGANQTVSIGSETRSLDGIKGDIYVRGGGLIDASVSNAASMVSQKATITASTTPFGRSQTVKREVWNGDHWDLLNTINFSFANPSRLSYAAGQVGDEIHVRGTLANVPTTVTSGAGQDYFHIDGDHVPLLAPVHVVGDRSTLDVAYYHDFNTAAPQSYFVDRALGKLRVARGGSADVYFSGLMQLATVAARNGGNQFSVREVPADLRLDLVVADNDAVSVGRPTPMGGGFIGGTMNPIQGIVTVTGGRNVSLVLDDTAAPSGRNATLHPADADGSESITGMGPGEVRWTLDAASSIDIRGGRFNDNFAIDGVFAPAVRIDGGGGTNTLDYSGFENNTTGPVGWYRGEFDFTDSAGGHHGTGMNGVEFVETGISGAGFYFDGIDDSVVIPNHQDFAPAALTLEARVGPNALDGNRVIVSKYDDSGSGGINRSWELTSVDGFVRFGVYQGTEGRVIQTTEDAIGTDSSWHITATFDPVTGDMRIYFDGREVTTTVVEGFDEPVTAINLGTSPVRIGARVVDGVTGGFWSGVIDDVRIYARALSAAEVQADFEAGSDTLPRASTPGVRVNLPKGTATGLWGGVSRIQNVIGSPFDDILIGNGGNILSGLAGRDILVSGRTPSTLLGGPGEDILIAGILYADDDDGLMNPDAIEAIAAEWYRPDLDYATRSSTLRSMLAGSVIRNSGPNGLYGQGDSDLFFLSGVDLGDWVEGEVRVTG